MTEIDLLVVGSGAAGFSAALAASHAGLSVLMVEKEPLFGGTTAYSAGVIWIPGNRHGRALGIPDSKEDALTYLQAEAGNRLNLELANAFLDNCNPAVEFIENHTHARYEAVPVWADYHPTRPGAAQGGRSLLPLPFDGRRLGTRFAQLRAPIRTMMAFGGMMLGRNDLPHVFRMTRSLRSAMHVAGMTVRYGVDRLGHLRIRRRAEARELPAIGQRHLEVDAPEPNLRLDDVLLREVGQVDDLGLHRLVAIGANEQIRPRAVEAKPALVGMLRRDARDGDVRAAEPERGQDEECERAERHAATSRRERPPRYQESAPVWGQAAVDLVVVDGNSESLFESS